MAPYFFHQGTSTKAYEYLGAHFCEIDGEQGVMFSVWAPHAVSVSVVGCFNDWNDNANFMQRSEDNEVFTLFIKGVKQYDAYKYCIVDNKGEKHFKADPYAFHSETRPGNLKSL